MIARHLVPIVVRVGAVLNGLRPAFMRLSRILRDKRPNKMVCAGAVLYVVCNWDMLKFQYRGLQPRRASCPVPPAGRFLAIN
jgi:hypothetical protein